jgi:hypothetical protein
MLVEVFGAIHRTQRILAHFEVQLQQPPDQWSDENGVQQYEFMHFDVNRYMPCTARERIVQLPPKRVNNRFEDPPPIYLEGPPPHDLDDPLGFDAHCFELDEPVELPRRRAEQGFKYASECEYLFPPHR